MSFSVETRSEDGDELVHKKYTFSYSEHFDQWTFHEYEEKRTQDTDFIENRNWSKSRHVWWDSADEIDVEIPQIVSDKLAQRLGVNEVNIVL